MRQHLPKSQIQLVVNRVNLFQDLFAPWRRNNNRTLICIILYVPLASWQQIIIIGLLCLQDTLYPRATLIIISFDPFSIATASIDRFTCTRLFVRATCYCYSSPNFIALSRGNNARWEKTKKKKKAFRVKVVINDRKPVRVSRDSGKFRLGHMTFHNISNNILYFWAN